MSGKRRKSTPPSEQFVKLPRELIESDAWRSLGVNAWRVVSFLMREHLRNGGKENGRLKAPYRQLHAYGVGLRHMAAAIREAEDLGLIRCERRRMRVATRYTLTWLLLHDGTAPPDDWRSYRNPKLPPLPIPRRKNLPAKGDAALPAKGDADHSDLPAKGDADAR